MSDVEGRKVHAWYHVFFFEMTEGMDTCLELLEFKKPCMIHVPVCHMFSTFIIHSMIRLRQPDYRVLISIL